MTVRITASRDREDPDRIVLYNDSDRRLAYVRVEGSSKKYVKPWEEELVLPHTSWKVPLADDIDWDRFPLFLDIGWRPVRTWYLGRHHWSRLGLFHHVSAPVDNRDPRAAGSSTQAGG